MSLSDLLSYLEKSSSYTAVSEAIKGETGELWVNGLWGFSKSSLVASLRKKFSLPSLFIAPTVEEAEKTEDDLRSVSGEEVYLFPAWETLPGEKTGPPPDTMADRLLVLEKLLPYNSKFSTSDLQPSTLNFQPLVVAPFQALVNGVVPPSSLSSCLIRFSVGQRVNRNKLMRKLVDYGYERMAIVEERGDFSQRGGILDIYPSTGENPFRLEFFADSIESIRLFSVSSQRSLEENRTAGWLNPLPYLSG